MLIRTQDGEGLINFENFLSLCTDEEDDTAVVAVYPLAENPFCESEPPMWWLGKYSTHKRALKVLDMIQRFYCLHEAQGSVFVMPQEKDVAAEEMKRVSLKCLHLSSRCDNALRRAGINTVGELTRLIHTPEYYNVRNLGDSCRKEIEKALEKYPDLEIGGVVEDEDDRPSDT